jgi:hypothetical protein
MNHQYLISPLFRPGSALHWQFLLNSLDEEWQEQSKRHANNILSTSPAAQRVALFNKLEADLARSGHVLLPLHRNRIMESFEPRPQPVKVDPAPTPTITTDKPVAAAGDGVSEWVSNLLIGALALVTMPIAGIAVTVLTVLILALAAFAITDMSAAITFLQVQSGRAGSGWWWLMAILAPYIPAGFFYLVFASRDVFTDPVPTAPPELHSRDEEKEVFRWWRRPVAICACLIVGLVVIGLEQNFGRAIVNTVREPVEVYADDQTVRLYNLTGPLMLTRRVARDGGSLACSVTQVGWFARQKYPGEFQITKKSCELLFGFRVSFTGDETR